MRAVAARAPILVAVGRMAPLGVQLVATPFVIARLGPSPYSVWALMMTTINLLLTADLGVVGIMQRYHGIARGRSDRALGGRVTGTVLAVLLALLAIATALGPWLASSVLTIVDIPAGLHTDAYVVFRNTGTLAVLQLVGLAFSSYLASQDRFGTLAAVSVGARVLLAVGIVAALLSGAGLHGLVLASYGDAGAAVLLGAWACRRHLTEVRGLSTRSEARDMWAYAWRNQASALGFVAQRELDVLMAGALLPASALATVAAAAPITAAASLAPVVLLTPLFTRLSVLAAGDHEDVVAAANVAERGWFDLVLPFSGVILAVLPPAAAAWIGPRVQGIEAVTAVLSLGFLLTLAASVTAVLVRAVGQPGVETGAYGFYVVVKIALGLLLARAFGAVGLAAAGAVAAVVLVLRMRRAAGRRVGMRGARLRRSSVLLTALVSVPAALLAHLPELLGWSRSAALVSCAATGVLAGLVVLRSSRAAFDG